MAYLQDISNLRQNLQSRDMGCVECMCVMTLIQEHVSCRHSDHHQVLPDLFFELTEWQQAGYKQKLKWTLECDRCDFKTTSKGKMFEHVATHQIIEETQNTIPLDDIPSPTLPTKRPRPSHSNHPSQILPKHRHLHPQPLPAHYSPIIPPSNSHPVTHQRTHSGHTQNLPQLHRASYPATAATGGAGAPALTSQKSTASAEAPAAAARRSMDSRVQEGTGDTISSAYDMVPLTDIQSATTSHNIRDHNIRDADSDNSMEGVIIKDEMSDSMDQSAAVILHSDEVDINLAAESHRNSIDYAAKLDSPNDGMVLTNNDIAVPQIIPAFKNGVPSGILMQRHPGVCTLSDTISVLHKLPPELLARFARLSNNRDMLYIHSASANIYGIPLPRSTKLTTTTFPSYDPTNSSYTGAKRTNVHAYDIDHTTRMLLEALLTHPTGGTRRRMLVPQTNKISVPHTNIYPSDTPPRGGPFITNRYNAEDHDRIQIPAEPAQMTAKNNVQDQPPT